MNTFLATPRGQEILVSTRGQGQPLERPEVSWEPATLLVDGVETPFERCEIAPGWWAAIGRVPDAVITIDSRGVPLNQVRLERIPKYPVPPLPDLAGQLTAVTGDLNTRFLRVPFGRVHGTSDYWALHSVEIDHIHRLAHQHGLSEDDRRAVQAHWLARIEAELGDKMERLRFKDMDSHRNSRIARRLGHRNRLYQVWSNTIGPGAKCWFGNRYTPIRHYTFRLRWRP